MMRENISYQESLDILNALSIYEKGYENVFFGNCLNRVLAQDIVAKENMPLYPTSAMDGYVFHADDLELFIQDGLKVVAINKAGESDEIVCKRGECIKTMTGARIPQDCDIFALVEHTFQNNDFVKLLPSAPKPQINQWIRQVGENYKEGEVLLRKGTKITPFEIGLLAELNCVFVPVFIRPKIAILSGGDEIIEVGEERRENTIRSVNNHLLKAIAQNLGAEAYLFPLLQDNKEEIRLNILEALKSCDILVTTGGASKGDFDYVQEVLRELCEMQFKGVKMKPGKPVGFGIYEKKTFVFGLPGFPNSCAVTFLLFVQIILKKLFSISSNAPERLKAILLEDVRRTDNRAEFRICDFNVNQGRYEVGFWNKKSFQSSIINNFCNKSALLYLEEGGKDLQKGDEVEIILLEDLLSL